VRAEIIKDTLDLLMECVPEKFIQAEGVASTLPPGFASVQARVIIAERDMSLGKFLRRQMQAHSYLVDLALDVDHAHALLSQHSYDLLVVDIDCIGSDGNSLLQQIKLIDPRLPALALANGHAAGDRVAALDSGADDCISKPFSFLELCARVRALVRRQRVPPASTLKVGDLTLNRKQFRVERAGTAISLTAKEFTLLEYLMIHAGETLSRAMIMQNVWNAPLEPATNLVDVYVKYVRDKIDAPMFSTKLIRTVRGVGYVISAE
jgi:DNA-binding response OmpR family regulator